MSFWILAALLTALVTGLMTTPLRQLHRGLALILIFLIPLLALGIYFMIGNPDMAN